MAKYQLLRFLSHARSRTLPSLHISHLVDMHACIQKHCKELKHSSFYLKAKLEVVTEGY